MPLLQGQLLLNLKSAVLFSDSMLLKVFFRTRIPTPPLENFGVSAYKSKSANSFAIIH